MPPRTDVWIEGAGMRAGLAGERLVARCADGGLVGKLALERTQSVALVGAGVSVSTDLLSACAARGIAVGALVGGRALPLAAHALWGDAATRAAQARACEDGRLARVLADAAPRGGAAGLLGLRLTWMALVAGLDPALGPGGADLISGLVGLHGEALRALDTPQALARGLRGLRRFSRFSSGRRVAAHLQEELCALASWVRGEREGWEPWRWDGGWEEAGEEVWPGSAGALEVWTPSRRLMEEDEG